MREIRLLKTLRHHHIVNLYEAVKRSHTFYLVFEYVERTLLSDLERNPDGLDRLSAKKLMYQLVQAIRYCHEHNVSYTQVVHRDIKPENILLSRAGILKLCDFGFARVMSNGKGRYTDYVSTRWYRAPELLVGDTSYGKGVDIWGIGCMLAEISTGLPLFPGESDIDTLHLIMNICGSNLPSQHLEAFMSNPMYQGVDVRIITGSCLDLRPSTVSRTDYQGSTL
jgi:cyclin-dependent kinase-like